MANSIEKIYFNRNIVCYNKQYKVCKNEPCSEDASYIWKIIPKQRKWTDNLSMNDECRDTPLPLTE